LDSLRGITLVLTLAFAAVIATDLVAAGVHWYALDLFDRAAAGEMVTEEEGEGLDALIGLSALLQVAALLACIVLFFIWFYRAHRNLGRAGLKRLEHSSGATIGWFFVPFMNLVKPYQVMREVWIMSHFLAGGAEERRLGSVSTAPVVLWWVGFLGTSFLGNIAAGAGAKAEELDEFHTAATLELASNLVDVAAAVLAVMLVRRIARLQADAMDHHRVSAEVFA
jgi:hypothetical protein